jgi:predicted TIM-barrel enzyme
LMLENMHDTPYLRGAVGPEIVAAMAILARSVKDASKLPCGVQILAGANREAMAVAHSAGLDFIRVEGSRSHILPMKESSSRAPPNCSDTGACSEPTASRCGRT